LSSISASPPSPPLKTHRQTHDQSIRPIFLNYSRTVFSKQRNPPSLVVTDSFGTFLLFVAAMCRCPWNTPAVSPRQRPAYCSMPCREQGKGLPAAAHLHSRLGCGLCNHLCVVSKALNVAFSSE